MDVFRSVEIGMQCAMRREIMPQRRRIIIITTDEEYIQYVLSPYVVKLIKKTDR